MVRNIGLNKILWLTTAILALIASIIGVSNTGIYNQVISSTNLPGAFGQDLFTIIASIVMLSLAVMAKNHNYRMQIIIFGILGYLFYAYGIYVIERVYNMLYYLYLIIFGLSFWSLVYSISRIHPEILRKVSLSRNIGYVSAGFALLVALIFNALWITQLLPLLQSGQKIEFLYSIYILDLCFIMPAFIILGIMTLRKSGLAWLLLPAMFVLGFTLIFSLVVSEMVKPLFNMAISTGGLAQSMVLSLIFLVLTGLHLWKLRFVRS
jgi:hypothetical protein